MKSSRAVCRMRYSPPISIAANSPRRIQARTVFSSTRNCLATSFTVNTSSFMAEHPGPAWKQVGELMGSPEPHGDRQWRCESETAGRILRAQAESKRLFQLVLPLLCEGFIRPDTDERPAGKN